MTMRMPLTASSELHEIYRVYETERRLHIVRLIAPLFCLITIIFFVGMLTLSVSAPQRTPRLTGQGLPHGFFVAGLCMLVLGALLHLFATYAAYREQATLAGNCVVTALLINIIAGGGVWTLTQGLGPFVLACYMVSALAIVVVGILADQRTIVFATSTMNVYILFLTYLTPREPGMNALLAREGSVICIGVIGLQWCFAGLMIGTAQAHRRTIQELGDTRLAFERAKQLDEIKDQFIRSVNHELRNPVMAMHGYVRLLQAGDATITEVDRREFIGRASRAGSRLIALLNRILDIGKLDRQLQDVTMEPVLLHNLVVEAAQSVDPTDGRLDEQSLALDVPVDFVVLADHIHLLQVLTNLLSNAAKYSPGSVQIQVAAACVAGEQPKMRKRGTMNAPPLVADICVRDHGLGIPPQQIPLLFERFVRLPRDITSSVAGSGLGLYLCKSLIESMHGKIWVESSGIPGEGTAVHVQLPLPPQAKSALGKP